MSRLSGSTIIIRKDPDAERDLTPPQLNITTNFDSRIYPSSQFYVSPWRVREIRKDATVRLVRQAVAAPMIHTPWSFVEKKGAPSEAKKFLEDLFLPKRDWLLQGSVYGALDFGWAPYELVYAPTKDGRVTISKFKQLLQDYTTILIYVDTGDFAGYTNWPLHSTNTFNHTIIADANGRGRTTSGYEVELLESESMNINLEVEGTDWYGISASSSLDSLVSDWDDVNKSANRYDKKVAGATWVIWYPVGKTEYQGTERSNDEIAGIVLSTLEASGGVAIPDEIQEWVSNLDDSIDKDIKGKWRIELISASTTSGTSFSDRQKYIDNLKVRVFGIPERSLLEAKFGTKADAETHAEIGLSTVDTKHRLIVQQYNKQAVDHLLRINWGEEAVGTVYIRVAPLVSSRFGHLKELYRMILQSPDLGGVEAMNLDMATIRDELSIPAIEGADKSLEMPEIEEPEPLVDPGGVPLIEGGSDNG